METLSKARIEPEAGGEELAQAIMARRFFPSLITTDPWEGYNFANQEIRISESTDCYGAVLWPSFCSQEVNHHVRKDLLERSSHLAIVLCYFLDTNRNKYNLIDKNIIELGAGTGLVTIVTSMLGADVTSTDLPNVLGNLQHNIRRNTKGRCKHTPKVTELCWGQELEQRFPRSSRRFDYILAADVVYSHPYLTELLDTFDHLCQDGTEILWAMRFRLDRENSFVERFRSRFHLEELYNLPSLSIKLYRAWKKDGVCSGEAAA